jgi:glycosyltransferase involved in cell wall biosynthesis
MPKLLLISTAYPPPSLGGTARMVKLFRWLPKCGWDPTLLTISRVPLPRGQLRLPDDPPNIWRIECRPWRRRYSRKMGRRDEHEDGTLRIGGNSIEAMRPVLRKFYCNFFEFPDEMWPWIKPGVRLGLELAEREKFDLIYSSAGAGLSGHFVASHIQRELGIPWMHEYRDLWARNPWRSIKAYWWRDRLELYWEKTFAAQSQAVAVMHERIAEILRARLPEYLHDRVKVVPNGFDPGEFAGETQAPKSLPLRLCYTGILYGGKRDLTGLFQAIRVLQDEGEAVSGDLEFIYAGSDDDVVREVAERSGVADVLRCMGRVPADEARRLQRSAQILVLVEAAEDDPWIRGNMPGKAYEYLGANRPVLALAHPEGSIADLYAATRSGVTLHPKDVKGIAEYLRGALKAFKLTGGLPLDPDQNAVQAMSWGMIVTRLGTLLDEAAGLRHESSGSVESDSEHPGPVHDGSVTVKPDAKQVTKHGRDKRQIDILVGGDFCPVGRINDPLKGSRESMQLMASDIATIVGEPDLFIVNLECPLTGAIQPIEKSGIKLKSSPEATHLLKELGVGLVTLANNHSFDFEVEGLTDTLAACHGAGIDTVGAGMDLGEAQRIYYKDFGGQTLAVINMAEKEFGFARGNRGWSQSV